MPGVELHWIPMACESPKKLKNMFGANIIRTLEEDVWFLKGIMNDWHNVFYLSNQTFRSRGSSFIKHLYSSPVNTEGVSILLPALIWQVINPICCGSVSIYILFYFLKKWSLRGFFFLSSWNQKWYYISTCCLFVFIFTSLLLHIFWYWIQCILYLYIDYSFIPPLTTEDVICSLISSLA